MSDFGLIGRKSPSNHERRGPGRGTMTCILCARRFFYKISFATFDSGPLLAQKLQQGQHAALR